MEKDIYLTEAPFYSELDSRHTQQQRTAPSMMRHRPQTAVSRAPKTNSNFLHESYYDDKLVKPGVWLYRSIVDIEEKRVSGEYSGPHLEMMVPETVLLTENSNSMVAIHAGKVRVQSYVGGETFMEKLGLEGKTKVFPCLIHSSIVGIEFSNSPVMSDEVSAAKVIPRSEGFLYRRFVQPYAATPNLFRLYYLPAHSRQKKKNYAYKMVSNRPLDPDTFKKKHRLAHQFIVDPSKEESYSVAMVNGLALQRPEQMSASLVEYLEKGLNVRITELVIDFIIDEKKEYWLHEIKSVRSRKLEKLWDIGNGEEMELLTDKNNHSQMCKLCGVMYSRHQLDKIVTNKLIVELVDHLRGRGMTLHTQQARKEGLSYVCQPCYEVIVAEHQLINVEKEFSRLLNITPSARSPQSSTTAFLQSEPLNSHPPTFKAWRLFFYIERIKNHQTEPHSSPTHINLDMKFHSQKEQFTKVVTGPFREHSRVHRGKLGLKRAQSAVLDKKRSVLAETSNFGRLQRKESWVGRGKMETATTMASKVSGDVSGVSGGGSTLAVTENYSIQKVKVYLFYTRTKQQSQMFANTELQFALTIGQDRFSGRSLTLQELKNKETCQRHSSEIFLFDQGLRYCNLEVTVGLICDGQVEGEDLGLVESDGLFYPSRPVSMSRPLPEEWMEVFTKGEQVCTSIRELSYEEIKANKQQKNEVMRSRLEGTSVLMNTTIH